MMIYNKSKKAILSESCKLCKSKISKSLGLMFKINPKSLVFVFEKPKKVSLHTFFVFFPIDVLYLDKKKKVVEIKKNFMPFTFYTPRKKALYVVELPVGAAQMTKTALGDKITF